MSRTGGCCQEHRCLRGEMVVIVFVNHARAFITFIFLTPALESRAWKDFP